MVPVSGFIPPNINCFTDFNPSKGDKGLPSYMYIRYKNYLNIFPRMLNYLTLSLGVTPATSSNASTIATCAMLSACLGTIKLSCTDKQP